MAVLGIHLGGYAFVLATALGLSALLTYVPVVYLTVKLAGATYLICLGVQIIRGGRPAHGQPTATPRSGRRAFMDSIGVELLNPKTAMFFLAFLPQFVTPTASLPITAQFLILGGVVNLIFSLVDVATELLASTLFRPLQRGGRGQRVAQVAGGAVLVGLGTRLAFDRS